MTIRPMSHRLARILWAVALVLPLGARAQAVDETQRRADLAQFRSQFFDRDRAYPEPARREAEARLQALDQSLDTITPMRFALELAQIAALADNGHSASLPMARQARSNRVPVRLVPFAAPGGGTDFHVVRARAPHDDLLGARLVAIDGRPLAVVREAAHTLHGGVPAWRDRMAPFLFESPQQLHALSLAASPDAARYRFALPDGREVERRLDGEAPAPTRPRATTERLLLPEVTPDDGGWRGALPLAQAPWSLRDAGQRLRWRHWPDAQAVVVDLRITQDTGTQRLAPFFDAVAAALNEHRPQHLVLDLRQNGGGDLTRARDFAASLPQRVPGRVFVLTSPWTFSAAIALAAYAKQAAPERVTLVGEHPGDRLEFFAEGRPVTLAHSGEVLLMATERHDYRDGCRRHDDCHAPVRQRPIAVPSLAPEIAAPWTFAAWQAGRDPALEAVEAALGPARPPGAAAGGVPPAATPPRQP